MAYTLANPVLFTIVGNKLENSRFKRILEHVLPYKRPYYLGLLTRYIVRHYF